MSRILWLVITHQNPPEVARMLAYWQGFAPASDIVVVHGGSPPDFAAIAHPQKIFIADPQFRTRHHQREKQSFGGVLRESALWLRSRPEFTHVHSAEYDLVPVALDLGARLLGRIGEEDADVLGHAVRRIDGTGACHGLAHQGDPAFAPYWREISRRRDPNTVLSMFGTGSFWTREAWLEIAALTPPSRVYFELFLPTAAHHLGFRVRDFGDQSAYIHPLPSPKLGVEAARRAGCWTVHPLKEMWHDPTTQ